MRICQHAEARVQVHAEEEEREAELGTQGQAGKVKRWEGAEKKEKRVGGGEQAQWCCRRACRW